MKYGWHSRCYRLYKSVEELIQGLAHEQQRNQTLTTEHNEHTKKLFLDVLDVKDALDRLLAIAPTRSDDESVDITLTNLRSLGRRFDRLFKSWHVTAIQSEGEIADPRLHSVLEVEKAVAQPHGLILKEIQKGYLLENEILRLATVIAAENLEET